jgi:hypothetical protein
MHPAVSSLCRQARAALEALYGPQLAILGLALTLALAWFGPGAAVLALPVGLAFLVPRWRRNPPPRGPGQGQMPEMERLLDKRLRGARRDGRGVLCITLVITGGAPPSREGAGVSERVVTTCLDRMSHVLRADDALFDLAAGRLGVVPAASDGLDAAAAARLAERLRHAADAAIDGIGGAESLTAATGLRLELPPLKRTAQAMIAERLAEAGAPPAVPE